MAETNLGHKKEYFRYSYYLFFGLGVTWIIYLCLNSPRPVLDDEIGHFLISRSAWIYPKLILNIWGRTVRTLLYMPPSVLGLIPARFLSIIMACLTVLLATKVTQKLGGKLLFLVPVVLWFQPWFSDFSYGVITEVPFSLFLLLGTYLWLDERETLASIPIGLLPFIRHEGIAITFLWILYIVYRRNWRACAFIIFPMIVFNLLYYAFYQSLAIEIFFSPKPSTHYGSGTWVHFVPRVLSVRVPVLLLTVFGLVPILKSRKKTLAFGGYVVYYIVHTVIYRFGLFKSGGYVIFLLPLAPAFAVGATLGAEFLVSWVKKALLSLTTPEISAAFGNLLIVLIVIAVVSVGVLRVNPHPLSSQYIALRQASDWLRSSGALCKFLG